MVTSCIASPANVLGQREYKKSSSSVASAAIAFPVRLIQQLSGKATRDNGEGIPPKYPSPHYTRAMSVAKRSLGCDVAEGNDWAREQCHARRLQTSQPLSWKIRWRVSLFSPKSQATVR